MTVKAFSEFLDTHPDVAAKVASCATYDEVAAIAKQNGFDVTGAQLTRYAAQATSELSDEALEAVAGGSWSGNSSTDVAIGSAVAGGAAKAASAGVSYAVSASIIVK